MLLVAARCSGNTRRQLSHNLHSVPLTARRRLLSHRCRLCRASFRSVLLAIAAETLYVGATLGLGALVSLAMRCAGGQSLGERAAGIRLVREVTRRL